MAQPPQSAGEHRPHALRREPYDADQEDSFDDGAEGLVVLQLPGEQVVDDDRPDHRSDDRPGAADDRHEQRTHRPADTEHADGFEADLLYGDKATGEPAEPAADGEGGESVPERGYAESDRGGFVIAYGAQAGAVRRP